MTKVPRAEHLAWAKKRAIAYADKGDVVNAIASLTSDLGKHPETADHAGLQLMVMLAMTDKFNRAGELRKFIEGFN